MVENKVDPIRNSEINHITNFDEDFWINKATILKKLIDDSTLRESILGENKESHFNEGLSILFGFYQVQPEILQYSFFLAL